MVMVKGEQNHRKPLMPMVFAGKNHRIPSLPKMTIVHLYFVFLSVCLSVFPFLVYLYFCLLFGHLSSSLFNFICLHFSPLLGGTGLRWSLKVDSDQPYACLVHSELYVGRDGNGWDGIDGWSS